MRSDWLHRFPVLQGLRFEVVPSWFKETLEKSSFKAPYEYAVETAKQKALEVANRMHVVSYCYSNELFVFRCCMLLWLNLLALLKWSLSPFFPLKANGCFPVICERWCLELPNQKFHACSSSFSQTEVACIYCQHHTYSCAGYKFHHFFQQSCVWLTSFHIFLGCGDRLHRKTLIDSSALL